MKKRISESIADAWGVPKEVIMNIPKLTIAGASELYANNYISKTEAERLLAFCNNSGPLFILGSVGIAIYSNIKYGNSGVNAYGDSQSVRKWTFD